MDIRKPSAWNEEIQAAWVLTLSDLTPASCMKTTRGIAIAAQAQWKHRELRIETLIPFAKRWHEANWLPNQWWQLATSLTLTRAIEPERFRDSLRVREELFQYPREFAFDIEPADWREWPELAQTHGSLRATLILLSREDLPRSSAIYWASKPVRISELSHLPGVKFHWVDNANHKIRSPETSEQITSISETNRNSGHESEKSDDPVMD